MGQDNLAQERTSPRRQPDKRTIDMTRTIARLLSLTSALALAALFAPGAAKAGNLADIKQVGDSQSVQVTQEGAWNAVRINQGLSSLPEFPGGEGLAQPNTDLPQWSGRSQGNSVSVQQNGTGLGVLAQQAGHGNAITVDQRGTANGAVLMQSGRRNTISVTQRNGFNFAEISQNGEDLSAIVHQRGGNVTHLQQDADGTRGFVPGAEGLPVWIDSASRTITVRQTNVWSSP
jgi:hypothetical protein